MAKPRTAKPTNGAVFSPKITLKNGRVIYAADYGLKAFCFSRVRPRSANPVPGTPVPGTVLLAEAWQSGIMRATYIRLIESHLSRKHPTRRSESYRLLCSHLKDQVQESIPCAADSQAHKRPLAVKVTLFTSPILLRYQTSEYPCSSEDNTNYRNNNYYFCTVFMPTAPSKWRSHPQP